ncbi:Plant/F18B13-26 protein [Melia azedarach]|uniref:Plant/F18B13-26 protein n=1 Tax=Melia azedarach TaxID=155640 RepID=A0ACC1XAY6_MELAZ|nr:Plant/F18B13-26 protein [Melia azedarach]
MATFQRSEVCFRRQGSSGLVWQDRFFSGDLNKMKPEQEKKAADPRELRHCQSDGSIGMIEKGPGRSTNNGGNIIHRTYKVSTDVDPPSPRVSGCWFCCLTKPAKVHQKHKF